MSENTKVLIGLILIFGSVGIGYFLDKGIGFQANPWFWYSLGAIPIAIGSKLVWDGKKKNERT